MVNLIFYLKMENLIMLMSYFFTLMMFFNSSSVLLFWVFLELNMLVFIYMMNNMSPNNSTESFNGNFYFFIIQSLSSLMFLFSILLKELSNMGCVQILMGLSLTIKMGLFPFMFWVIKLSKHIDGLTFSFLMTWQKIPPFLIMFNFNVNLTFLILIINMLIGSLMLFYSKGMMNVLISSSVYSTLWSFILFVYYLLIFVMFMINYFFIIMTCSKNMSKSNMNIGMPAGNLAVMMMFMFLMGIPPLSMIFMKIFSINSVFNDLTTSVSFIIWFSTFISVLSYFKFFYKEIFFKEEFYKYLKPNNFFMVCVMFTYSTFFFL